MSTERETVRFNSRGFAASGLGCVQNSHLSAKAKVMLQSPYGQACKWPHSQIADMLPTIKVKSPLESEFLGCLAKHCSITLSSSFIFLPPSPLGTEALGGILGWDVNGRESPRWQNSAPAEKWDTPSERLRHFLSKQFSQHHTTYTSFYFLKGSRGR